MTNNFKTDDSKRTRCEIWTRVMGYCRPVSNFNKGKKSEFAERKFFTEKKTLASMAGLGENCSSMAVAA